MKQGQLLLLSTEQYSDYSYSGPYEVMNDFEFSDIVAKLKVIFATKEVKAGPDDVRDYLLGNSYIREVECTEVHLGSYGAIDINGAT